MQILRTVIWVLILFGLLVFSFFNWDPVEVILWDNLVLETKVPVLVIVAFLLGLLPMWLYHRGAKWNLNRRITSLENAVRSNALSGRHQPTASPAPVAGDSLSPSSDEQP
ncbi:DUF1049 domain-containing protein [Altererythrobacter litoralis]|uniref:DUF1049 domain-containing protein n=1 Tax=Altererythrobacter litoralis TaxID=3113904 RepID=A0ABU7GAQ0_9SPHN|nr:DUF1049 domain-containing protein [Erythrobacteraceae bacterium 1XM1-14]